MKKLITTTLMILGTVSTSSAAQLINTSSIYSSGYLVGLFLGFCALIVTVQLIPTAIMVYSFAKALFTGKTVTSTKVN